MTYRQMEEKTIVRLKIVSSNLTPKEISAAIGLRCNKSWRPGDRRGRTIIRETTNGWILNSGLTEASSLEEQISHLLNRLEPSAEKLRALSEQESVELSCVIYASASPALNFSKSTIDQISRIGASLDIDLYLIPDDEV